MGRNRKPRPDHQRKRLTMTKPSIPVDTVATQSDSSGGQGVGSSGANQRERIIKLVDVQEGALTVIYPLLAVAIVDGEVYANGILIGRLPSREKAKQGNGRIHKIVVSKKEIYIII